MRTSWLLLLSLTQCVATIDEGLIPGGASPCSDATSTSAAGGEGEGNGPATGGASGECEGGSGGAVD